MKAPSPGRSSWAIITPVLCGDGWDMVLRGEITPRAMLGKKQVVVKLLLSRVSHLSAGFCFAKWGVPQCQLGPDLLNLGITGE